MPAMRLPRVNAWWGRVILINSIQLLAHLHRLFEALGMRRGASSSGVTALDAVIASCIRGRWARPEGKRSHDASRDSPVL